MIDKRAARGWGRVLAAACAPLLAVSAPLLSGCVPRATVPPEPAKLPTSTAGTASSPSAIQQALLVRAARIDVSFPDLVPDLAEEPRWPLTGMQHPSLQPSYDVADALAEPGITWTDLCARNVDRRRDPAHHDELVYLSGWCAAERHDTAAAVGLLAQVRGSAVPGIARGVGFDIANILVDTQDEEHADQILGSAQVRSAALYDLLAAAYFEIGRNDDALRATGAALQLDVHPAQAATCHRLARAALLAPDAARGLDVTELDSAAHARSPDPVCVELAAEVSCAMNPDAGCLDYNVAHRLDHGMLDLAGLAQHWAEPRSWQDWMKVALRIHYDGPRPQTLVMESAALDAAVVGTECRTHLLNFIAERIDRELTMPNAPGIATKLEWARTMWKAPEGECVRFRTQWLRDHPQ